MIHFRVVGTPIQQGSKTAVLINGRAVVIDAGTTKSRKAHKAWRKAVHDEATLAIAHYTDYAYPLDEPIEVKLQFWMPRTADPYRTRHAVLPDIDKIVRSTLDGITTSGLWVDDSRVFSLSAEKFYVADDQHPGCRILIVPHGIGEATDRTNLKLIAAQKRKSNKGA